ncbi:hypothetical protein CRYUN_Cryun03dG0143900 [Craigia yunnanensis]
MVDSKVLTIKPSPVSQASKAARQIHGFRNQGFAEVFRVPIGRENKEMAATIAARSSFLRPIFRTATTARTRIPFSVPNPSLRSNFTLRQTRISPPSLSRLVRRELSTLQPVHSAVASACLVSKLPRDANSCAEGRFANYLSPI